MIRGSNSRRRRSGTQRKDTAAKREKHNRGINLYQQKREIWYKEEDMEWIWNDIKFSFWHIGLMVTKLISVANWSVWFAINAKEGDCWKWLKRSLMMELVKNVFNHYFVIDVKLSICRNDNCLNDPSTIT